MDKLISKLGEMGINVNASMDPKTIQNIAKGVGINPLEYVERQVEIVPYTNKRGETNMFVRTPALPLGMDAKGKLKEAQGVFVRLEALDQLIEDLLAAKGLISKK